MRHRLDQDQISAIVSNEVTKYPLWKEFLNKIDRSRLLIKIKQSWSLFCIIDIFHAQRMNKIVLKAQNNQVILFISHYNIVEHHISPWNEAKINSIKDRKMTRSPN